MSKSKKVVAKSVKSVKLTVAEKTKLLRAELVAADGSAAVISLRNQGLDFIDNAKWDQGARRMLKLIEQVRSVDTAWFKVQVKREEQLEKKIMRADYRNAKRQDRLEAAKQRKIAKLQAQLDKLQA